MQIKRSVSIGFQIMAILIVVSLSAGQFLGQPVLLSFVETGSMEPTLDPGDGFVAIPGSIAGEIGVNDVITFEAEEIQGGGLTTHRVVEETERGYITRGDNNPFTDQDGGEPVVQDASVVAKALTIGGSVVVIPNLGTGVTLFQSALQGVQAWLATTLGFRSLLGAQGLGYLFFGLSLVAYVVDWLLTGSQRNQPERDRSREDGISTTVIIAVFAAVLITAATAAVVVPAGTQEYGVVSAEFDSGNPTVIEKGTSQEVEYPIPNAGFVPIQTYVRPASTRVTVDTQRITVGPRQEASTTVTLAAPETTGYYRLFVVEHRYLAVLPPAIIDRLYQIHPWVPLVTINSLLASASLALGYLLFRGEPTRVRDRDSRSKTPLYRRLIRMIYE